MPFLRFLGTPAIEGDEGPLSGAASRRRSIALLALSASAREQGIGRERVLEMLWPESDPDRARNNLKQTLFVLRRNLGADVFAPAGPVLRLDSAAIQVDIWQFADALAAGDWVRAVETYRGPFLDGFYVPGAADLDRWTEVKRATLARRYREALTTLAGDAASGGDARALVSWRRRLAALDPVDAGAALALMEALAADGDRAGALQHARIHEALVREELDQPPSPAITALVARLRTEPLPIDLVAHHRTSITDDRSAAAHPAITNGTGRPAEPGRNGAAHERELAPSAVALPGGEQHRPESPPARPAHRARAAVLAALALPALVIIAAWLGSRRRAAEQESAYSSIAVLPFAVNGGPEVGYLRGGIATLLSTSLDQAGSLRSVQSSTVLGSIPADRRIDPAAGRALAKRFGAKLYVLGDVTESGGRLRITAQLFDPRGSDTPVAQAAVAGDSMELFDLVDRLGAQLIAGRYASPRERLAHVAALTTSSLPALKAYLEGEQELDAGRYPAAADDFERAVRLDSTFALAYYRLSTAAEWSGRDSRARAAAQQAYRYAGRLTDRDRRLLEAYRARLGSRSIEAERLFRSIVADYPDDVEAWFQLGEVLFHDNPLRGRSATEARPAFERVLALDPSNGEALVRLARIASIEGDSTAADTLVQRALAVTPDSEVIELRAFRAFALGDPGGQKRVTSELLDHHRGIPSVTVLDVAVFADDLAGSERFARVLLAEPRSDDVLALGHRMLAQAALARGRVRLATAELDTASTLEPVTALEFAAQQASLPFIPTSRSELAAIRAALERWRPDAPPPDEPPHNAAHAGMHQAIRQYYLGLVSWRLGDTSRASRAALQLERSTGGAERRAFAATLARSIRARLALGAGDPRRAVADLDRADWGRFESILNAEAGDRFLRAELLHELGREDEALGWYASIAQRATYELAYLAPSEMRQGEIHERRGERPLAIAHYRRFVELWRDADIALQPTVADARSRLTRLETRVPLPPPPPPPSPPAPDTDAPPPTHR